MKVKELKEILQDVPDDWEIVLVERQCFHYTTENICTTMYPQYNEVEIEMC